MTTELIVGEPIKKQSTDIATIDHVVNLQKKASKEFKKLTLLIS